MGAQSPKRRAASGGRACGDCGAILAWDNTGNRCSSCVREQRDQYRTPPAHLPDEFWETDDFKTAFKAQNIGKVIKVYRNHPLHRKIYGKAISQSTLGRWLNLEQSKISRLEGGAPEANTQLVREYAQKLHIPQRLLWILPEGESFFTIQNRVQVEYGPGIANSSTTVESLRESLTETLSPVLSDVGMDDWDQRVLSLGRATRYRTAGDLVVDLSADIRDLHKLLSQSRSFSLSRRLTRALAQVSGLMSLTLLKVDDRSGSRDWARTARTLAAETGDKELQSWVFAQEAYFHFYDRNYRSAVESAQYSEDLTNKSPSVGGVLSAALQARAHALLGDNRETFAAVGRAETYLEHLGPEFTESSAFGYDEAQLRFHQGNALTQLGSTKEAMAAQDQALELYPEQNYLDRALVQLDRAQCFIQERDLLSALDLTTAAYSSLEPSQVQGMIAIRIRETLELLPSDAQSKSAVIELREAIESEEGK